MRSLLYHAVSVKPSKFPWRDSKDSKKPTNLINEEMADDYVAFLLDLWHHGQMVHKINKTDLHEQVQDELSNLEMTNEGRTKLTKALRKI